MWVYKYTIIRHVRKGIDGGRGCRVDMKTVENGISK